MILVGTYIGICILLLDSILDLFAGTWKIIPTFDFCSEKKLQQRREANEKRRDLAERMMLLDAEAVTKHFFPTI